MRTKLLLIATIIFTVLFTSCDDGSDPKPPKPPSFLGEATLTGFRNPQEGDGTTIALSYSGEGTSNEMEHFEISFSSYGSYQTEDDFEIADGSFEMTSGNDGLFGTISGNGYVIGSELGASQLWVIEGGSGKYADASGRFSVQLSSDPSQSNSLKLVLSGGINTSETSDELVDEIKTAGSDKSTY